MPRTGPGRGISQALPARLELDPSHEKAHFALGYQRFGNEWRLPDAHQRKLGLVPYKGGWAYPQDAHLDQERLAYEAADREVRSQIRMWRSWLRRRGKEADALANLATIDDPIAAPILAKMLLDKDEPAAVKSVYIKVLARIGGPVAVGALANAALADADAQIRSTCLDALSALDNTDQPASIFIAALKQKDPVLVNRAAAGLARLKREDAIPHLIDALVIERIFQIGGGGGDITPTFGSGGGGGINVGGGPQLKRVLQRQEAVRDALAVLTGVNQFDYNQNLWRQWYMQQNTPVDVQLRRRR